MIDSVTATNQTARKNITIGMWPYNATHKNHYLTKSDNGKKRRYLVGISSGSKFDGHEERMTEKCIKSFMDQANSGMVLLYPDVHGIKASEDIGKLITCKILQDGDWYTEYQLYEASDGIGPVKSEKIDTIWKQITGQPPYDKPLQKGFSIEGYIPDESILSADQDSQGNLRKRIIDDVRLDGVCLVPKQAYKPAVASFAYKALGEITPYRADKVRKDIKGELQRKLDTEKSSNEYFKKRWDLMDALDSSIEKIMSGKSANRENELEIIFDEYAKMMVELIIQSEAMFTKDESKTETDNNITSSPYGETASKTLSKIEVFKAAAHTLDNLINRMV
jgi:hypothetical protein